MSSEQVCALAKSFAFLKEKNTHILSPELARGNKRTWFNVQYQSISSNMSCPPLNSILILVTYKTWIPILLSNLPPCRFLSSPSFQCMFRIAAKQWSTLIGPSLTPLPIPWCHSRHSPFPSFLLSSHQKVELRWVIRTWLIHCPHRPALATALSISACKPAGLGPLRENFFHCHGPTRSYLVLSQPKKRSWSWSLVSLNNSTKICETSTPSYESS